MGFDSKFAEGQAKACRVLFMALARFDLAELIEDFLPVLVRYPPACVSDRRSDSIPIRDYADTHGAVGGRELDGVVQKVLEDTV